MKSSDGQSSTNQICIQQPIQAEAAALRNTYRKLQDAICYQSTIDSFAADLYSEGFITKSKQTEAQSQYQGSQIRCQMLLDAVENEVKNDPPRYYDFLKILRQDAAMKTVIRMLEDERRKIAKLPDLVGYTGPLKGLEFDDICDQYRKAIMSSNLMKVDELTETIMADEEKAIELKVFMLCYQGLAKAANPSQLDEAKRILEDCLRHTEETGGPNTPLLQGRVYRILAGLFRLKGDYKKGLEFARKGKKAMSNAVPSCETSCLLMEEALLLQLSEELTPQRQADIEKLLEDALKQAWKCKDRQRARYTVSLVYLRKSSFYLNTFGTNNNAPILEANLVAAEECLKKVELNIVGGTNRYQMRYQVAWSAFHQYRNNPSEALRSIRKANDLLEYCESEGSYLHVRERHEMLQKLVKT